MSNQEHNNEGWYMSSEFSNIKKTPYNSRISSYVNHVHSTNVLSVIGACCQIFLGMGVVAVSILGLISPLWLSTFLSMAASITTMIGLYLLYITLSKSYKPRSLLRSAMRRIMESKN